MKLRNLIWKIFPPYEVMATVDVAKSIFSKNDPSCRPIIEPIVIHLIRDAEKTLYSVRIEHIKPEHLALILITNVLGRQLGSGLYHSYRNRLDIIGLDMLQFWNVVQSNMLEAGYISVSEKTEDDAWLQRQIASAG